ncbi:hypothetical protein Leryth_001547 [Lithospermum erythrorhizon]|nr:hypothetical protein Leryth_001547 [Lithospermum erythrorhizon]
MQNYDSFESIETAKVVSGKDLHSVDGALLPEIDETMKKIAIGNNYGSSDGKMRRLENLLREVQSDVHLIKDKQEIIEAQFELAKLQVSKAEQQPENHNSVNMDKMKPARASAPQQLPPGTHSTAPPSLHPPNSVPPPPQQSLQQHVPIPKQYASSHVASIPQRHSYFTEPGHITESGSNSTKCLHRSSFNQAILSNYRHSHNIRSHPNHSTPSHLPCLCNNHTNLCQP